MAFNIILLPRAKMEISDAINWYESRQIGLGKDFLSANEKEIQRIGENPSLYPKSGESETKFRKAIVKKYPFLIIFTVSGKQIFINSVFHTHLDPNKKPSA